MARKLTKKEVERLFREDVLPSIRETYEQDGKVDRIARAEAWSNYTSMLREDGLISDWTNPY